MLEVAARVVLGGVLAWASLAKLASPGSSSAALASFGISGPRIQRALWAALIVAELTLAAGVIAGSDLAAGLAAALMAAFAATMLNALFRGRAGAPCACFGARSTVSRLAVGRNLLLASAFAALPFLPSGEMSTDAWLGLGLVVALLGCAGLALAVLALAREVGMLRLRLGPSAALEIDAEGPALGSSAALPGAFARAPEAERALAVFHSEDCRVCRALEPSIAALEGDPGLAVVRYEERADAAVWDRLEIPGSPYALVVDRAETVLAKGTFNDLGQLESLLTTAGRRAREGAAVHG